MSSLQIMEGLIGAACAVACLYYARIGALAAGPQNSPQPVPWHSALGEFARRNPFAAVFGALALGFLLSSWGMYVSPRAAALPAARTIEKWHTITRTVAAPDPVLTARAAELQTTINADTATIASQQAEIGRLNRLLATHRKVRTRAMGGADAAPANTIAPEPPAAELNMRSNPAALAPPTNAGAGASPPPSGTNGSNVPASGTSTNVTAPAATPNAPPPNSANPVPH